MKKREKTNHHHQWQSGRVTAVADRRHHQQQSGGIRGAFATAQFHFISFHFLCGTRLCYCSLPPSATPLFLLLLFIIEQSYYISAPSRLVSRHCPLHHYSAPVYVPMPLFTYATSKTKPDALRHVLIVRLQPSSGNADSVGSLFSSISTKSTKNERCYLPPLSPLTKQCKGQCYDLPACLSSSVLSRLGSNCLVMRIRQAIH